MVWFSLQTQTVSKGYISPPSVSGMVSLYQNFSKSQAFLGFIPFPPTFDIKLFHKLCQPVTRYRSFSVSLPRYLVSNSYNCLHKESSYVTWRRFWFPRHYGQLHPRFRPKLLHFDTALSHRRALTFQNFCGIFSLVKSCDEDTRFRKDSQRGSRLVKGFRAPAENDTTSEPYVRKCHTGCARYRVNEWLWASEQPGWNRGIPKLLYPTPDHSGGGYFLYLAPESLPSRGAK